MSTGDQSLNSARDRLREMALDPEDLASRGSFYEHLRQRERRTPSTRRRLLRGGLAVTVLALVAAASFALWTSGPGTAARDELGVAGAELSAWADAQVSGDAVASPTEAPLASPEPMTARILGTSGHGVSVRDRCTLDARTDDVLREGSAVTVLEAGTGACAGWFLVEGGGVTSWVSERYLERSDRAADAS